jgi:MoxR-like ATPase
VTETIGRVGRAPEMSFDELAGLAERLCANLARAVVGAPRAVAAAAAAALAGGHLLVEDVPGVGKTVLAHALAASLGAGLRRIQGHADLLPGDVTGVSVFSPEERRWEFRPGPVFAHVVLVDELNRTPPRTQSALLEAMEEGQVSVDGESWPLPHPHLVVATQNPLSQRGTFPLVESQLDRFALSTSLGYPGAEAELEIVRRGGVRPGPGSLTSVCDPGRWSQAQAATAAVVVADPVAAYAVAICRATRHRPGVELGASPRAAAWLVRVARARAVLAGRPYVVPDDVKGAAEEVLAHRLVLAGGPAGLRPGAAEVEEVVESTPAPPL